MLAELSAGAVETQRRLDAAGLRVSAWEVTARVRLATARDTEFAVRVWPVNLSYQSMSRTRRERDSTVRLLVAQAPAREHGGGD
jgi:hypothetical protein